MVQSQKKCIFTIANGKRTMTGEFKRNIHVRIIMAAMAIVCLPFFMYGAKKKATAEG